jgi:large subunit ribosomal protein L30
MLRIKLVKSPIGNNTRNRATVTALGLRKVNHTVEHQDTPTIRGMIHHVKHMLLVEEVEGNPTKSNGAPRAKLTKKVEEPKRVAKADTATEAKPKPKAKAAAAAKPKATAESKPKPATAKGKKPSEKKSEEN